jgi:adenosine deaminase
MNYTELHRHLDVSIRTQTLLELAQKKGFVPQSTSLSSFREELMIRKPMKDLNSVLNQFSLFQKVLDRPEVLERVAFEVVEDCRNEGIRQIELRYSPAFVSEYSKLSWDLSLSSFYQGMQRALKKYPDMKAGLICIATRDSGKEGVDRAVEFFLQNPSQFIAIDLAANEIDYPCRLFEDSFKKAIKSNSRITIHAGEAAGPENMWEAIELLGAQRIGHGIAAIRDPQLMKVLAEKNICLEICPTSNWLTQAVIHLSDHPLPKLLRAGVPVSINTDDPGIFGVTIPDEIQVCKTLLGMSDSEIQTCQDHARNASFL